MEILSENAALLSNYEVLDLLRNVKHDHASLKSFLKNLNESKGHPTDEKGVQNLNTIVYETLEYLEQTPCSTQSKESMQDFLMAVKPFSLTKAEKLQLLNLRPTTLVEVQLIIEEAEERLSEDQMQELIEIIDRFLPPAPIAKQEESESTEDVILEDENT